MRLYSLALLVALAGAVSLGEALAQYPQGNSGNKGSNSNEGSHSNEGSRPGVSSAALHGQEEVVFVRLSGHSNIHLETTIFKPKGKGPYPLVVMNHGKAFSAPSKQARARYPVLSQEFVKRGYAVVIPMRQGFSQSGGRHESTGCDLAANGRAQARDVDVIVRHFQKLPWIRSDQVLVIGQSHGGLITMAYGENAAPGVKLLVNFAGGLRSNAGRCKDQWADQMLVAFERFGERAKTPSIWFYGQNDRFFEPALVKRMHAAYLRSDGARSPSARLVNYGSFGEDAHGMVEYSGGVRLWWPELERELKRLGLPG